MTGPLGSLFTAYNRRRQWTLDLPYLGLPGCIRGASDPSSFPKGEDREFNLRTKCPYAIGVEVIRDGIASFVPVTTLTSPEQGHTIVKELVAKGVHPLDIIVGEWRGVDDEWILRTSVDHLWWTTREQADLERSIGLAQ